MRSLDGFRFRLAAAKENGRQSLCLISRMGRSRCVEGLARMELSKDRLGRRLAERRANWAPLGMQTTRNRGLIWDPKVNTEGQRFIPAWSRVNNKKTARLLGCRHDADIEAMQARGLQKMMRFKASTE